MKRREFVQVSGLVAAGGVSALSGFAVGPPRVKSLPGSPGAEPEGAGSKRAMTVGSQRGSSTESLRFLAALGVRNICGSLPSRRLDERWSVESLVKLRERVESFGIQLDMLPLPLNSVGIGDLEHRNILLGKSPERDREIDDMCRMIQNAAKAGIHTLKYNLNILGVVRTGSTRGRGGSRYSTFVYDKAKGNSSLTAAGRVDPDDYWDRITYFLERVIPVAEECKVRMACHPHDPPMPHNKGYRGLHRVLGSVEGLKRLIEIAPSPYHGLNFCQGTVAEMLEKPGEEIYGVIRYFGTRQKIFNVHFRNIRGGFLDFQESFIDDGDMDMLQALRVYQEVGYEGMIMPDHVPAMPGDRDGRQAYAYTVGYIKALIAAVETEG